MNYFNLSAQEPGRDAKIPTVKLGDSGEVFYELALEMASAIRANNAAGHPMPTQAITAGIRQILSARKMRLGIFREWHRAVVRQAAYGHATAHFPVSLLQDHPDAVIYTNAVAAARPF